MFLASLVDNEISTLNAVSQAVLLRSGRSQRLPPGRRPRQRSGDLGARRSTSAL